MADMNFFSLHDRPPEGDHRAGRSRPERPSAVPVATARQPPVAARVVGVRLPRPSPSPPSGQASPRAAPHRRLACRCCRLAHRRLVPGGEEAQEAEPVSPRREGEEEVPSGILALIWDLSSFLLFLSSLLLGDLAVHTDGYLHKHFVQMVICIGASGL